MKNPEMVRLLILAIVTNSVFGFFWKVVITNKLSINIFLIFAGLLFVAFGLISNIVTPNETEVFPNIITIFFMVVACLGLYLLLGNPLKQYSSSLIWFLVICLVADAFFYLFNSRLLVMSEISRIYPTVAIGTLILLTIASRLFLHEPITQHKTIGILLGIASIVFLRML
jgi:drug/metabolite transporter (DMT)-like permease